MIEDMPSAFASRSDITITGTEGDMDGEIDTGTLIVDRIISEGKTGDNRTTPASATDAPAAAIVTLPHNGSGGRGGAASNAAINASALWKRFFGCFSSSLAKAICT